MFIDTSGWFVVFDSKEIHHHQASALYLSAHRFVTHSYILAEFVALSEARKKHRPDMLVFLSNLLKDSEIEIVWIDEVLTHRAVELLRSRPDKTWSLCDAVSFILMTDLGMTEALTTDRHFEQAGFIRLLLEP